VASATPACAAVGWLIGCGGSTSVDRRSDGQAFQDSEQVGSAFDLLRALAQLQVCVVAVRLGRLVGQGPAPPEGRRERTMTSKSDGRANPRLYKVKEVAERLRVCERTVYRLIASNQLGHRRVNRMIRISEEDLLAFERKRRR
jgi:excisionase family DNA binding protein